LVWICHEGRCGKRVVLNVLQLFIKKLTTVSLVTSIAAAMISITGLATRNTVAVVTLELSMNIANYNTVTINNNCSNLT